jgi:hypothetical protein
VVRELPPIIQRLRQLSPYGKGAAKACVGA